MAEQFSKLYFQVKSDDSPRCGEWFVIRAERPEGAPGLRWIWFVLFRAEFEAIVSGERTAAEDGYHRLHVSGDLWTFYDQEFPRDDAGVMTTPYVRLTLPRTFMRAALRLARKTWAHMARARAEGADRYARVSEVTIDVGSAHYAHVNRVFGFGKGSVTLVANDDTRTFLDSQVQSAQGSDEDRSLARMLERVQCIARNSTQGTHEAASLFLSKDWDGFFWRAVSPRGHTIMHGGIVNHGAREGKQDWSIHT